MTRTPRQEQENKMREATHHSYFDLKPTPDRYSSQDMLDTSKLLLACFMVCLMAAPSNNLTVSLPMYFVLYIYIHNIYTHIYLYLSFYICTVLYHVLFARMLPAEWHRSVPRTAVLTPFEGSSAGLSPPPRQHQHHHSNANPSTMARGVSAPSDTRSHTRRLSGSSLGGFLHQLHPRSQALETSGQRADSSGMGQEAAASAAEVEAADTASAVAGRSRRLSVSSRRPDRRGSLSPVRRLMAGVAAKAAGVQTPETSRRKVDSAGTGYEAAASAVVEEATETASAVGRRSGRLSVGSRRPGRRGSLSPTRVKARVAAAIAAGTRGGMERGRSTSPKRGDERELVLEGSTPTAGDTFP